MLHFAGAKIMQEWSPLFIFFEVFSDTLRKQNVPGVPAIHHPLRHVEAGPGEIGSFVYINNPANRSAVHPHPKLETRMLFQNAADFHRALCRPFRTRVKYQRHSIPGGDFKQTARGFGSLKLFGRANDLGQLINHRVLVVNRKLRITDNVDEQDMRNLELDLFLNFGGHVYFTAPDVSFWKRGSLRSGSNIGSSRSRAEVSGTFAALSGLSYGVESSFCKAEMARSGSPIRAVTRARISIEPGLSIGSFSIGFTAITFSTKANAAVLSPRPILVSARSPIRTQFSGCCLRKGSSSLRACFQLSWAAAWSPATSYAQPNQKRSSPLR